MARELSFDPAQQVYRETMDALIDITDRRIGMNVPVIITDLHDTGSPLWDASAQRESWQLLKNGLQHLKEWAPGREPGSITAALTKASLRSSAMAVSLGVLPPQFMDIDYDKKPLQPKQEALFIADQLVTISMDNVRKSHDTIAKAITEDKVMSALGIDNAALKKLFQAVAGRRDIPPPPQIVSPEEVQSMQRQMHAQLKTLTDAYTEVCKKMKTAIFYLPLTTQNLNQKPSAPDFM